MIRQALHRPSQDESTRYPTSLRFRSRLAWVGRRRAELEAGPVMLRLAGDYR